MLPQDTDHAGVLWHGSYVAWLEEARVVALAEAGVAYAELSAQGLELMVVDRYKAQTHQLRSASRCLGHNKTRPTLGHF